MSTFTGTRDITRARDTESRATSKVAFRFAWIPIAALAGLFGMFVTAFPFAVFV